jgi:hypothetical protein
MAGLTREARTAADRLPDRAMVALLTRTFPPALVDAAIREAGVRERRSRALPARLTVYFTLALWVWARAGYDAVLRNLLDGLWWMRVSWGGRVAPSTGSITKARARLGWQVMATLFKKVAGPVGIEGAPGVFWRGLRVCVMDTCMVDVPDTVANDGEFGRPRGRAGSPPFPQVRVVALVECGTGAMIDAAVGGRRTTTRSLVKKLARSARPDTLIVVSRVYPGMDLWERFTTDGASLLWRTSLSLTTSVRQALGDGTYLSQLRIGQGKKVRTVDVRVITYTVMAQGHGASEPVTLLTTLTDPLEAPAVELAQLYMQRWQLRPCIGAIKEKRADEPDLRSKSPRVVYQETWALLCFYQAVRDLVGAAARGIGVDACHISLISGL